MNTQLEMKGVLSVELQLGQKVAKVSFLVLINLATNKILGTAYVDKHSKKSIPKKGALKRSGSSPVAIKDMVVTLHILPTTWKQRKEILERVTTSTTALQPFEVSYHQCVKYTYMEEVTFEAYD